MLSFLREVAFFLEELTVILIRLAPLIAGLILVLILGSTALDFLLGSKEKKVTTKIVIGEELLSIIIDLVAIWNGNLVYFNPDSLPSGYTAVSLENLGVQNTDQLFLNSDNRLVVAIKNVLLAQPNQPDLSGLGFVADVIGELWETTPSEQQYLYANFVGETRERFQSLSLPISETDLGRAKTALARRQTLDMLDP
jgi:hypothetical protein